VGKSTTAVSLGASLAELGYIVLVVDLDPQGNASTGLGIRHEEREVTVYDVLADEAPIEGAIVPTPIDNLFAIPSTIDLAGAEIELVSQFSRELRLKKAIEPLKHDAYDFVFLDCPPSLGLLTVNALAAAEELIVPIQCEYYALEGLGQLLRNVRLVQQNVNTDLRLTGIVMTMFDPRTKLSEQVVAEVRRYFGDRVYRTIIPRTVRLSEAPGFGQPITVYDPHSKGAESYRDLAKEVAARLPDESPLPNVDDVPSVVIPRPEAPPGKAPRPLIGPEDRPAPGRSEPVAGVAPDEDLPAMPDPGVEPDADASDDEPDAHATDDVPGEPPPVAPPRPVEPPPVEPPGPAEAPAGGQGVSHPPAESSPTVDQGSRDVVEEPMDLNGDRTQAEPEDEMQLDRGGSTDPGGGKRRRGLFRRGGT
jgi:chromosome partitioning protein